MLKDRFVFGGFYVSSEEISLFFACGLKTKSSMATTAWKNHLWVVEARNFSPDFHYLQAQVGFDLKVYIIYM